MDKDYRRLGFKAGIEIHQQLETHKLFCSCPTQIRDDSPDLMIERRMRAVAGEVGDIDPAALHEFLRNKKLIYQAYLDTNCLVELDEEPPHPLNTEALETALEIALLLNAEVVDEIQVMRKTVIDGSNTSGFQRTMLVAADGFIDTEEGRVNIPIICLEEDAARKISEEGDTTVYRLDRLGIPLVEIGTDPDIKNPRHARKVAEKIGLILRATGKVKRGLGTIRQDLNISIKDGERIEIKGVQDLKLIAKVMENEVERQLMLIEVKKKLKQRGVKKNQLKKKKIDLSNSLKKTKSKLIKKKLKEGKKSIALNLPGFRGLLKKKLGPELAQYAKAMSGVKGIIHSDELPGYGITEKEVKELRKKLKTGKEDAYVLVIERKETAEKALDEVLKRCLKAFDGVPDETRRSTGDGGTEYMRPLPGSARMYPETDEPLIRIDRKKSLKIKERLPELPEEQKKKIMKYGLNEEMANQVLKSEWSKLYQELITEYRKINPTLIATTLVSTPKEIKKRFNVDVRKIREEHYRGLLKNLDKGLISKETIPEILTAIAETPEKTVDEIIKGRKIAVASIEEIKDAVDEQIKKDREFIQEAGMKAIGPLTGKIMEKFKGRADGKQVSSIIKKKMNEIIK